VTHGSFSIVKGDGSNADYNYSMTINLGSSEVYAVDTEERTARDNHKEVRNIEIEDRLDLAQDRQKNR